MKTHLQIHHCIDLFLKKLDRLLPTVIYAAIIGTVRVFDVFWLNCDKHIAMMVRAFQGVLCVNKPIFMVCYKALCDGGQLWLPERGSHISEYNKYGTKIA